MAGTRFRVELNPRIPSALGRLPELAGDLYYSWDRYSRGLFYLLDKDLWERCRHNPKLFLRRVSAERLEAAAGDRTFLESYHRALANYDTYLKEHPACHPAFAIPETGGPVAYFCAEFGLHESLPIYSGGLGILAGDLCKAASDMCLPFVAVGLLYRHGNFIQTIDDAGNQHMSNAVVDNDDLPIVAATDVDGDDIVVKVRIGKETVAVKVWRVQAGHIELLLLDTDIDANAAGTRTITHHLYPGDKGERLRQEIVLGFGGVAALGKAGVSPGVWHINEGHPSLTLLARCHEMVGAGLEFDTALELCTSNTVFTTHTPVSAGHEVFEKALFFDLLRPYVDELGVPPERLLGLGHNADNSDFFSLTAFALRCSASRNGVSRIHGGVAAKMESHIWPEIPTTDNPIDYVTNGVHVPTFLAREWINLFDDPAWRNRLMDGDYWRSRLDEIPSEAYWSVRRVLKFELIKMLKECILVRGRRLAHSDAQIERETVMLDASKDVMLVGFARRFATYKRATLLFDDPARLRGLLTDNDRPVVLIFAGRAHQADGEGQALIREIHKASLQPELHGRLLLVEGYDLALARKLVAGVDVWVNAPEYPLEASGTSGIKAAINGVVNLSIADGWWAEGFDGTNGWAVQPHPAEALPQERRRLEAREMLDVLEFEAIPRYFDKTDGHSPAWVSMSKAAMASVIPRFNAQRMLSEYVDKFYVPALERGKSLRVSSPGTAGELAAWRARVRAAWPAVKMRMVEGPADRISQGDALRIGVELELCGLSPADVVVECLLVPRDGEGDRQVLSRPLAPGAQENERAIYRRDIVDVLAGLVDYRIRAYPFHPLLAHPFDMGLMKWL
jgi:glycogen phosphorylase